jgi:hypothetical protein
VPKVFKGCCCNIVRASERNIRAMPSTSLNWARSGQQLTLDGAWQRWIGLPEGAQFRSRLNIPTSLSETFRSFVSHFVSPSRTPASPCAGSSRDLAERRSPRNSWRACGQLEDGVPHARALSPANMQCQFNAQGSRPRSQTEFPLVVSSLAPPSPTSPV